MERDDQFPVNVSRLDAAWSVLYQLEQAGFQAYLVGGCVRDMLLGNSPDDYDVATNALPSEVQELFPRTVPTGIRHGTVTVLMGDERIEVTTFRTEGEYADSRRPASVKYVSTLEVDLSRRDFTINAMAMDRHGRIIDPFEGRADLQKKTIRAVGEPEKRFQEDALRMLRAIRFAVVLHFSIEERTWLAITENAGNLSRISRERIRDEWNKIILSDIQVGIQLLNKAGLFDVVFPDVPLQSPRKLMQAAEFAKRLPEKIALRQAALFRQLSVGETAVQKILRELRQPNALIRSVISILRAIPDVDPLTWTDAAWRRYLYCHGKDIALDAFLIVGYIRVEKQNLILNKLYESIQKQPIWSVKDLTVTGQDLIAELNIPPDPVIGHILERLTELVLENPLCNTRQSLLAAAREMYENL
ncbi:CCA tRNA nucleotidyltransferase [Effusibacillus consociatus]|uniref:CCA tRNA nucleotidyltransferase n=1 Tax=Effusibacillus consociatus TaxID=1117041 RepID=A0ABV9Q380_9BACL